jgi:hypothetical protein
MHKGNLILESQKQIHEVSPQALLEDARVLVVGYFYAVDFGFDARTGQHRVGKDRRCTCSQGADCPAIQAVADYLKAGGERAPDPPPGYFPVAPAACPVCGAETYYVESLSSRRRGAGWACIKGGQSHYWEAHTSVLRELLSQNPWLFPPIVAPDGSVVYPGLRRDEVITQDGHPGQ